MMNDNRLIAVGVMLLCYVASGGDVMILTNGAG